MRRKILGTVYLISLRWSLSKIEQKILRMVVLPLLSRPMMMILSSFLPESLEKILVKNPPMSDLRNCKVDYE